MTVDQPTYFPSLGVWAKPGDTVTRDADGVVTVKVKGKPYDPDAPADAPADVTPDTAPEES